MPRYRVHRVRTRWLRYIRLGSRFRARARGPGAEGRCSGAAGVGQDPLGARTLDRCAEAVDVRSGAVALAVSMLTRMVHAPTIPVLLGLFIVRVAGADWHCDTDWDLVQLFDHGAFLSTCEGRDSEYCQVECDAGYLATKSWYLEYPDLHPNAYWCHCLSATECTWGDATRDLGCQATECLSDQPVPNATHCKHRQIGQKCEVECNAGYYVANGGLGQYTCAATGEWEGGSLACAKTRHFCRGLLPTGQHAMFDPPVPKPCGDISGSYDGVWRGSDCCKTELAVFARLDSGRRHKQNNSAAHDGNYR
eukprot:COSAG02_NODE_1182_length_14021_cov_4.502442_13_plen_307_part_00